MRSQGLKQGAGSVLDASVLTLSLSGLTGTVLAQDRGQEVKGRSGSLVIGEKWEGVK